MNCQSSVNKRIERGLYRDHSTGHSLLLVQKKIFFSTFSCFFIVFLGFFTSMDDKISEIDRIDNRIIDALVENGRISITELSEKVGLSKTPCQLRLKRLVSEGYITGFRAVLNPAKMGMDHIAFAEVKLSDTREDALRAFNAAVKKIREVEECHMIASSFDYLLKVRTSDIKRYRIVLGEKISTLPYVASTSTFVVMQNVVDAGFRR